ncbi:unnamed protein product [Prorocentrum cordatum]|uniref:RRM domain-containing protein n=1 Tax=Prorocentrum cordatum TaxID=2364126 RepID=A0ABN9XIC1_9DINO|nr:unnamed protein product [Polarella glacialis]
MAAAAPPPHHSEESPLFFVPKRLDLEVRSRDRVSAAAPMFWDVPGEHGSGLLDELDSLDSLDVPAASWTCLREAAGLGEMDSDASSTVEACTPDAAAFSTDGESKDAEANSQDGCAHDGSNQSAGVLMGIFLVPCMQEAWAGGSPPTTGWSLGSEPRPTSLTLVNVPAHYTENMLKWTLDALGLLSRCDFVYLPRVQAVGDALTLNMGHALLNFVTPDDADLARDLLSGHAWDSGLGHGCKHTPAAVVDAAPQGYQDCTNYVQFLTWGLSSNNSMLDWLDVPALRTDSQVLQVG